MLLIEHSIHSVPVQLSTKCILPLIESFKCKVEGAGKL